VGKKRKEKIPLPENVFFSKDASREKRENCPPIYENRREFSYKGGKSSLKPTREH